MEEPPQNNPPDGGEDPGPSSGSALSLFLKLFVAPALIVVAALGIFLFGALALQHPKSARQYLDELKNDSTSRRWQAAYELSRDLNRGKKIRFGKGLREDLVKTFEGAKSDDPRVREYLALVLGRLKEKSAVPALSEAVRDGDNDVKIYSLWALGNIEDPAGGPAAQAALSNGDPTVQRMAVGALSAIRYKPAQTALEERLTDSNLALRYDAAVALARLKDERAVPTLLEMMGLNPTGKPTDALIRSAKIAAIQGALALPDQSLHERVQALAQGDSDLKVREAALAALKGKPSGPGPLGTPLTDDGGGY